jgi:hypothetical protein
MSYLCKIKILVGHMAGTVSGQLYVATGQLYMGIYNFETACGSITCCIMDGIHVYFDADKISILSETE